MITSGFYFCPYSWESWLQSRFWFAGFIECREYSPFWWCCQQYLESFDVRFSFFCYRFLLLRTFEKHVHTLVLRRYILFTLARSSWIEGLKDCMTVGSLSLSLLWMFNHLFPKHRVLSASQTVYFFPAFQKDKMRQCRHIPLCFELLALVHIHLVKCHSEERELWKNKWGGGIIDEKERRCKMLIAHTLCQVHVPWPFSCVVSLIHCLLFPRSNAHLKATSHTVHADNVSYWTFYVVLRSSIEHMHVPWLLCCQLWKERVYLFAHAAPRCGKVQHHQALCCCCNGLF